MDGGNPGTHPVTLCGYGTFHGQTPLAGRGHPPVEKWPLLQPTRKPKAQTVDDSVSLRHAQTSRFKVSIFSISPLAFSPLKRGAGVRGTIPQHPPPMLSTSSLGSATRRFFSPSIPTSLKTFLMALALRLLYGPFLVPVLHLPGVSKVTVLGKVAKRGEITVFFGTKIRNYLKRKNEIGSSLESYTEENPFWLKKILKYDFSEFL